LILGDIDEMRKNDADYNIRLMKKIDDIIKKEFDNISDEQILYHYTNASSKYISSETQIKVI
jgi:FKBP-type peptidyl-prolyl cis-trans isomerase (trigger factor)